MSAETIDFNQRLASAAAGDPEIARQVAALVDRLATAAPRQDAAPDAIWSWRAVVLALEAAARGNYGVGAIIAPVDAASAPAAIGVNAMFAPRFDSGAHAEMRAIEAFEASGASDASGLALTTSLEPCPMCLARFLNSRLETLKFVAWDEGGGMVSRLGEMPPVWRSVAATKAIGPAECGPELREIGFEVFALRARTLDSRLRDRSGA